MSAMGTITYNIQIINLEQVKSQTEAAAKSADMASKSQVTLQQNTRNSLLLMVNALQIFTTTQHAIMSVQRALKEASPEAWISAFLSMLSVAVNLIQVMRLLQKTSALAGAAQAVVATLSGQWWLIPLALAAGALVYSASVRSYATGGPIQQTGIYMLHKGEYVVPANQSNYGPFYISFNKQPGGPDVDAFLREIGPSLARNIRRGG